MPAKCDLAYAIGFFAVMGYLYDQIERVVWIIRHVHPVFRSHNETCKLSQRTSRRPIDVSQ
ncbi:MAG: hypothetical protein ACJASB_001212 [Shewanella psychromarinicola]|jgi:hypothetical protein